MHAHLFPEIIAEKECFKFIIAVWRRRSRNRRPNHNVWQVFPLSPKPPAINIHPFTAVSWTIYIYIYIGYPDCLYVQAKSVFPSVLLTTEAPHHCSCLGRRRVYRPCTRATDASARASSVWLATRLTGDDMRWWRRQCYHWSAYRTPPYRETPGDLRRIFQLTTDIVAFFFSTLKTNNSRYR